MKYSASQVGMQYVTSEDYLQRILSFSLFYFQNRIDKARDSTLAVGVDVRVSSTVLLLELEVLFLGFTRTLPKNTENGPHLLHLVLC